MRYWALLAGKLVVSAVILSLLWWAVSWVMPAPRFVYQNSFLGYDLGWTLIAGVFFLLGSGLLSLSILDQRYRCRVCARRLRMPILTGSWGQMLQKGRPGIEYICPYGHGTLKVSELQISGHETADWTAHGDIWDELAASR